MSKLTKLGLLMRDYFVLVGEMSLSEIRDHKKQKKKPGTKQNKKDYKVENDEHDEKVKEEDEALDDDYVDSLNSDQNEIDVKKEPDEDLKNVTIISSDSKVSDRVEKITCKECEAEYDSKLAYDQHVYLVHSERGNEKKCVQCNKKFSSDIAVWNHIVKTCKPPPLCAICGRTFKSKKSLDDHMPFHDGNTTCEICGKIYERASCLKKHIRVFHERKRVVQCEICNKEFQDPYCLKSHMDFVHLKVKNFSCDKCEYMCVTPTMLENHMKRKHENTKDIKCEECGKSFLLKLDLKRHFNRVHKQLKPYQCSSCEKTFFTNQCLKKHFARIHEQKREKCPYCGDLYAQLKEHVKRVHTDVMNKTKEMSMI